MLTIPKLNSIIFFLVFLKFWILIIMIKIDRLTLGAKPYETHAIGTILVASMIRQRTLTLWCQNSRNGTLILDGSMIRVLIIDPTVLIFWVCATSS